MTRTAYDYEQHKPPEPRALMRIVEVPGITVDVSEDADFKWELSDEVARFVHRHVTGDVYIVGPPILGRITRTVNPDHIHRPDKIEARQLEGRQGQRRRHSGLETLISTLAGMVISLSLQAVVFPMFGFKASAEQHLGFLAIFTWLP